MKRVALRRVLALACAAAALSAVLPVSMAILHLLHGNRAGAWLVLALAELFGLTAVLLQPKKRWQRALLQAAAPVPGVAVWAALWGAALAPLLPAILCGVLALLSWLLCRVLGTRAPRTRDFFVLALVYILCGLLLQLRGAGCETLIVPLLLCGCCYAADRNYASIDGLMQRRGHAASELPPKSRLLNLLLLACVGVVAVLLVLGRGVLMPVCGWVFRQFGLLIAAMIRFFNWVMLKILREPTGDLMQSLRGEAVSQEESALVEEEAETAGAAHPGLQIGFLVLVVAVIAVFALWKLLRARRHRVRREPLLHRILRKLRSRKRFDRLFRQDENESYIDVEEAIDAEGAPVPETAAPDRLRAYRRAVRALGKLPPGRERFLKGWRLSVTGLQLHGVAIAPSDTPLEILEKATILTGADYEAATACCNALRYGGMETPDAQQALDTVLARLRK